MKNIALSLSLLIISLTSCFIHDYGDQFTILQSTEQKIADAMLSHEFYYQDLGPRHYNTIFFDKFWLGFKTYNYRFKTPQEARFFFVETIRYILRGYNNAPQLRPFLKNNIVTPDQLWVQIDMYRNPTVYLAPEYLFRLELKNNVISYYRFDEKTEKPLLIFSEKYENAVKNIEYSK